MFSGFCDASEFCLHSRTDMQTWSCSVSCRIFSYLHTWYPHRGRGKKKKPKHCKRQNGPESSCHTNCFLKTKGQTFFTNYEKQTSATLHGFLCPMHSLQSKCTREIFAHSLGRTLGHLYALVKTSFYRGTVLTLPDTFAFVLVTSAFQRWASWQKWLFSDHKKWQFWCPRPLLQLLV